MLKIGDFARLGQVSVRMLRHYDAIGLLEPAHVDGWSGYRSYSAGQLARLNRLVALKELGFTLDEVRGLLDDADPNRLATMLADRRRQLQADAADAARRLAEVERRRRMIETEDSMSQHEFVVKPLPALRLADVGARVESQPEIGPVLGELFARLLPAIRRPGADPRGPSVCWYELDAAGDGMTAHAAWPYSGEPAPDFDIVELPAEPQAVSTTYVGPIAGIAEAWQAMARWWSEQGLEPSAPCRELTMTEPPADPDGDWVIELQQPVRPA